MKKTYYLYIFFLFVSFISMPVYAQGASCAAGYDCSRRGVGETGGEACGNTAWEALLVQQESGGSYTIGAGNSSALGRYQFINSTREMIGDRYNLPCASGSGSRDGFAQCPGLQDDYGRALWANDLSNLMSNSQVANNVNNATEFECPVTASGITALAHNVGPGCARLWAIGGEAYMKEHGPVFNGVPAGTPACTDANGTNAVEKYACAMGGYDMSTYGVDGGGAIGEGCGFGFTPADPASVNFANSNLLGCDPAILEQGQAYTSVMRDLAQQTIDAYVPQPVSIEEQTCVDQYGQLQGLVTAITGDENGAGIMNSMVVEPLQSYIQTNFAPSGILGDINSLISEEYGQISEAFSGAFDTLKSTAFGEAVSRAASGLTQAVSGFASGLDTSAIDNVISSGGLDSLFPSGDEAADSSTNCDMSEKAWKLLQCADLPEIPSMHDYLNDALGEVTDSINKPFEKLEQMCGSVSGELGDFAQDYGGNITNIRNLFEQN